jgi:hypothetical protein
MNNDQIVKIDDSKEYIIHGPGRKFKIRKSNESDFITNGEDYQLFPGGINIISCAFYPGMFNPRNHSQGIKSLLEIMLYLNPGIPSTNAFRWFRRIAQLCGNSKSYADDLLMDYFFPVWESRSITKPEPNVKKKVVLRDDLMLNWKEKRAYRQKVLADFQTKQVLKIIFDYLDLNEGAFRLSKKVLSEKLGISRPTLDKYIKGNEVLRDRLKPNRYSKARIIRIVLIEIISTDQKLGIAS